MRNRHLLYSLPLLAIATTATARDYYGDTPRASSVYVGASVGVLRYDESGLATVDPSLLVARIGLPVSPYLSLEGRLGTGLSSDETAGNSVSVGTIGGAYVKGSLPLGPTFSLYGVAGIDTLSVNRNFGRGDTTDTGLSFGVGGDVALPSNLSLNIEWTHLPNGNDVGYSYYSNILAAGVNWRF